MLGKKSAQAFALAVEKESLVGGKTDRQLVAIADIARFRPLDDQLLAALRARIDIAGIAEMFGDIDMNGEIGVTRAGIGEMLRPDAKRNLGPLVDAFLYRQVSRTAGSLSRESVMLSAPVPMMVASRKFIFGEPTKPATKRLAGSS